MDKFFTAFHQKTANKYPYLRTAEVNITLPDERNGFENKVPLELVFLVPYSAYDTATSNENQSLICQTVKEILPSRFSVRVSIRKSYCTAETVMDEIVVFLTRQYVLLLPVFNTQNCTVEVTEGKASICITLEPYLKSSVEGSHFVARLIKELSHKFCEEITCTVNYLAEDLPVEVTETDNTAAPLPLVRAQTIAVQHGEQLWGKPILDRPSYIYNARKEAGGQDTVCGEIVSIYKGLSKARNKRYYIMRLDDHTGKMSVKYFSKSSAETKLDLLKEGDQIICSGRILEERENENYAKQGKPFNFMQINAVMRCVIDFSSIDMTASYKKEPYQYKTIKPKAYRETVQRSILDEGTAEAETKRVPVPEELLDKTVVAVALTVAEKGGKATIGEIAMAKQINGVVTETLHTYVRPEGKATSADFPTGVSEKLDGAPPMSEVMGDVYKFCRNSVLVFFGAASVAPILKAEGEKQEYLFDNECACLFALAQRLHKPGKLSALAKLSGLDYSDAGGAYRSAITIAKLFYALTAEEALL